MAGRFCGMGAKASQEKQGGILAGLQEPADGCIDHPVLRDHPTLPLEVTLATPAQERLSCCSQRIVCLAQKSSGYKVPWRLQLI